MHRLATEGAGPDTARTPGATPSPGKQSLLTLAEVLESRCFPLTSEKATQAAIAEALAEAGVAFEREAVLGPGDIVDFLVSGPDGVSVALEVKLKARAKAVYRQLKRYAAHPQVDAMMLASATSMGLPETIEGKPATVFSLGLAWL